MAEPLAIVIPRENVNDDVVTLVRWHAANGERVRAGSVLFEIETAKTVYTVEAEQDGYLEILCEAGEEIGVGERVGRLHEAPFQVAEAASGAPVALAAAARGSQGITRKARELIEKEGLDLERFAHLGIVREADVRRALEARAGTGSGASGEKSALPAAHTSNPLKDMFVASRERGTNPVALAFNYLFRNYLLGLAVRIAPRGVILPLHRLRGVKIGHGCFIDPTAIIETAYPENITIGDDVRVAAGAVLMTHLKAPHYLRETDLVPNVLKPIVLEDHCFVGIHAVVMPGVRVGEAAVVVSGSVVLADVPPFTMVSGNPARVIKRFVRPAPPKD